MVTVTQGGKEVRISKRAGSYMTIRDLVDEVGRDAVRYFFLMRKSDTHFVFDVDLAKSQTEENPVFYVQIDSCGHHRVRLTGGDAENSAHTRVRQLHINTRVPPGLVCGLVDC